MNHIFQNWAVSPKHKTDLKGGDESSPWILVDDPTRKSREQIYKKSLFHHHLNSSTVPLENLRALSLKGIPSEYRSQTWRYLLSLCPPSTDLYSSSLEYLCTTFQSLLSKYFHTEDPLEELKRLQEETNLTADQEKQRERLRDGGFHGESIFGLMLKEKEHQTLLHQIEVDVKRTSMGKYWRFFTLGTMQRIMCRVLLVWSSETPELGYIQGLTDLIAPLCVVYSADYLGGSEKMDEWLSDSGSKVPEKGSHKLKKKEPEKNERKLEEQKKRDEEMERLLLSREKEIQRDIYFSFTKMMSYKASLFHFRSVIVERNTQFLVSTMRYLVSLRDRTLLQYLDQIGVDFFHFTFRWLVTLLVREFPLDCGIRLFDTFFSEGADFTKFHTYICASFLLHFGEQLKAKQDFQESLLFLQRLPTTDWTVPKFEEVVLIPAYRLLDLEKQNYDRLLATLDQMSKLLIPVTILHHRMSAINYLTYEQQQHLSSSTACPQDEEDE